MATKNDDKLNLTSIYLDVYPTSNNTFEQKLDETIIWILYTCNKIVSFSEIEKALIGQQIHVSHFDIEQSVKRLKHNNHIPKDIPREQAILTDETKNAVKTSTMQYENALDTTINKYFKTGIVSHTYKIKEWLIEMLSHVIEKYHTEMLNHLRHPNDSHNTTIDITEWHDNLCQKIEIDEGDKGILLSAFHKVLDTNDAEVNRLLLHYVYTCYTSIILTSKTHTDTDISEKFRGKTFVLDTNVLIPLQLEKACPQYVNLDVIDDLCSKLEVSIKYLPQTRSEYEFVVKRKNDLYKELYQFYPSSLMQRTDDNIVRALKKKGCYSTDQVEHFFQNNLLVFPEKIGAKTVITPLNNQGCKEAFILCQRNEEQKEALRSILQNDINISLGESLDDEITDEPKERRVKKREGVVEHDLGFVGVVRTLRGYGEYAQKIQAQPNDNYYILTRDYALLTYANQLDKDKETPLAYHIRDLITLLALNRGGLKEQPLQYITILKGFISNNFIKWNDALDIKDLSLILNVENKVSQLPEDVIIRLTREVNKMRLQHKTPVEIHEMLDKEMQFEYSQLNLSNEALIAQNNALKNRVSKLEEETRELPYLKETIAQMQQQRLADKTKELFNSEKSKREKEDKKMSRYLIYARIIMGLSVIILIVRLLLLIPCLTECLSAHGLVVSDYSKLLDSIAAIAPVSLIGSAWWNWSGLKEYRQRKENGYYSDDTIKKFVVEQLQVDIQFEKYINSGELN